jgi:RNA-directed DNA polymerase
MREEPLGKAKPFDIPKRVVWEAYQRVKANRGAAGVDDQSIEAFDQDVKNNLFKLWNRLSSGSYFPCQSNGLRSRSVKGVQGRWEF